MSKSRFDHYKHLAEYSNIEQKNQPNQNSEYLFQEIQEQVPDINEVRNKLKQYGYEQKLMETTVQFDEQKNKDVAQMIEQIQTEIFNKISDSFNQLSSKTQNFLSQINNILNQDIRKNDFKVLESNVLNELNRTDQRLANQSRHVQKLMSIVYNNSIVKGNMPLNLKKYQQEIDHISLYTFVDLENILQRYQTVKAKQRSLLQRLDRVEQDFRSYKTNQ